MNCYDCKKSDKGGLMFELKNNETGGIKQIPICFDCLSRGSERIKKEMEREKEGE